MDERKLQAPAGAHAPTPIPPSSILGPPDLQSGTVPRFRGLLLPIALIAGLALAASAAGEDGRAAGTARSADAVVTATASNSFDPAAVTIGQGETVTWTNVGGGEHNVVFEDGSFTQPASPSTSNWTVSRSFSTAGSFRYYCAEHSFMRGTVTVNASAPPPGEPPPPPSPSPSPTPPAGRSPTAVTLRVSDRTPARGARIRFFGTVRPEQDGRLLQLQRRRRGGSYRTVERIRLRDAGTARSTYSKRLRVVGDAVFRARIPADAAHLAGTSRARRVDVR
jgi:plastocyanin